MGLVNIPFHRSTYQFALKEMKEEQILGYGVGRETHAERSNVVSGVFSWITLKLGDILEKFGWHVCHAKSCKRGSIIGWLKSRRFKLAINKRKV